MHDATPDFIETVRGDAEVIERVEFVFPEGDVGPAFDVLGGDFQIDSTAAVRHNASLELVSDTSTRREIIEALREPGTQVRYLRGLMLPHGEELKRVLTGEVSTGGLKRSRDGINPLPVKVFDSFTRLQWPSTHAFGVAANRNYATAIKEIITRFAPMVKWADVMDTEFKTPPLAYATETEMAGIVTEMAQAIGGEIYFDAFNELNIAPIPLTTGRPIAWVFDCDLEGQGIIDVDVTINYDLPNGVIVTGQHSSGGTVQAGVYDMDATSPTFWEGGYGKRPYYKKTEKVTTEGQCRVMAAGILRKILGGSYEVVLTIIPNPLLVLGDLCRVRDEESGIDDTFIIRSITGSCGADSVDDPMVVKLRRGVFLSDPATI